MVHFLNLFIIIYMCKTNLNKFCLVQNFRAPQPKTWSEIKELMRSTQVINICKAIAELDPTAADYEQRKAELKKQLPAITVHACEFESNRRSNDNAIWNGLVCLEYDHLSEAEIKAFQDCQLPYNVHFAAKSCSGTGVWFLIDVPYAEYKCMKRTLEAVHQEITQQIHHKTGFMCDTKVDILTDLARLRFLVPYDYVWIDEMSDFPDATARQLPNLTVIADIVDKCQTFDNNIPIGERHNTYKKYVVELSKITENKQLMLKHLPTLGLDEKERIGLINWGKNHIETKADTTQSQVNLKVLPLDAEALPCPIKKLPKLIQTLVKKELPRTWQTSATMCLLPALSTAAGALSLADGKPLAFQVALFGLPGSGKTDFSARPATFV